MISERAIKTIRDPIYGVVHVTPAEQLFIDQPAFQRLRFVLQQSTAYLTFPNNTTSRFAHSLGAAHMAGQMFLASLINADEQTVVCFLKDANEVLRSALAARIQFDVNGLIQSTISMVGDPTSVHHSPPLGELPSILDRIDSKHLAGEAHELPSGVLVRILWQTVRFTSLLHDLGHMPLSHLFERAITDYARATSGKRAPTFSAVKDLAKAFREAQKQVLGEAAMVIADEHAELHEMLGFLLFSNMFGHPTDPESRDFLTIITWMAKATSALAPWRHDIKTPPKVKHLRVLRFLHSLVSGDLDADRLDYSVRDPVACSMEFGSINQLKIARCHRLAVLDDEYIAAIDRRAQHEVEFFFIQRFYALKSIVHDHNVFRSDSLVKEIVQLTLQLALDGDDIVRQVAEQFSFVKVGPGGTATMGVLEPDVKAIARFDDSWFRAAMYRLHENLRNARAQQPADMQENRHWLEHMINIVLHRHIVTCASLMKFDLDAVGFYNRVYDQVRQTLQTESRRAKSASRAARACEHVFGAPSCSPTVAAAFEKAQNRSPAYPRSKLRFIVSYDRSKFPRADLSEFGVYFVDAAGKLWQAGEASPVLHALSAVSTGATGDSSRQRKSDLTRLRLFAFGPLIEQMKNISDRQYRRESTKSFVQWCEGVVAGVCLTQSKQNANRSYG